VKNREKDRQRISKDVEAYLAAGGKITRLPYSASGQDAIRRPTWMEISRMEMQERERGRR